MPAPARHATAATAQPRPEGNGTTTHMHIPEKELAAPSTAAMPNKNGTRKNHSERICTATRLAIIAKQKAVRKRPTPTIARAVRTEHQRMIVATSMPSAVATDMSEDSHSLL